MVSLQVEVQTFALKHFHLHRDEQRNFTSEF